MSINRPVLLFLFIVPFLFIHHSASAITWRQALRQPDDWYNSVEALRVAENVLAYQRDVGGWEKNIDMAQELDEAALDRLIRTKPVRGECTIDNGGTTEQMTYLAKIIRSGNDDERFRASFIAGLDFLLGMQYENGGFPQFPYQSGYKLHITFNDNAMIRVMDLLRGIVRKEPLYGWVSEEHRLRAQEAVEKGIDCILKCQVVVDGKLTAWCAQHDERTLEPAPARTYEKISLSGAEGAGIVEFLMGIEHPSAEVIKAVESAAAWFRAVKITGIEVVMKEDPSLPRGYDRVVVENPSAGPLWARFYEIGTNRPIFSGRDGIVKYSLAEIEHERRVGYSWYTDGPEDFLDDDYTEWRAKWVLRKVENAGQHE